MIGNRQKKVRVASSALEKFLRRVKKELGVGRSAVTVCFVDNAEMARMNQRFRKKHGPTDVLSFPASASPLFSVSSATSALKSTRSSSRYFPRTRIAERGKAYLGDIAIAPGVARRYAKKNGRTLDSELRVLILHGVLHLLGYDHEADTGEMDQIEHKMRRKFGLA